MEEKEKQSTSVLKTGDKQSFNYGYSIPLFFKNRGMGDKQGND